MNSELRDLYQEVILDHNKRPRNTGALADPTNEAEGHNPLCGDHVHVYVKVEDDRISDVSFEGEGCAISKASASLMTESVKGKTLSEAQALVSRFRQMVAEDENVEWPDELASLEAFSGVKEFPVRVKCATLPWHALQAALTGQKAASTE